LLNDRVIGKNLQYFNKPPAVGQPARQREPVCLDPAHACQPTPAACSLVARAAFADAEEEKREYYMRHFSARPDNAPA
jgi:hypothetical protein